MDAIIAILSFSLFFACWCYNNYMHVIGLGWLLDQFF